jgi:hypothetical protein
MRNDSSRRDLRAFKVAVASLLLAAASVLPVPAFAQDTSGTADTSGTVTLVLARTESFRAYASCLQSAVESAPCQPPAKIELPADQPVLKAQSDAGSGAVASAWADLVAARSNALAAYAQCQKAKAPAACGSPP